MHGFADRYIRLALERQTDGRKVRRDLKPNFLDYAASRKTNHDDLRSGVLHLLVAGRDSTASLLGNLWHSLARDKRVWMKLKAEVDSLEGAIPSSSQGLKHLPYLRHCINECKQSNKRENMNR